MKLFLDGEGSTTVFIITIINLKKMVKSCRPRALPVSLCILSLIQTAGTYKNCKLNMLREMGIRSPNAVHKMLMAKRS